MQVFLSTGRERQGPLDESAAIDLCLDGNVDPDSWLVDRLPHGGWRRLPLSHYPRLHRAAMEGRKSPNELLFAECPVCRTDIFAPKDSSTTCPRCESTFRIGPKQLTFALKRHSPATKIVSIVAVALAAVAAVLGKRYAMHPGLNVAVSSFVCVALVTSLIPAFRRGIIWHRGFPVTTEDDPFTFVAMIGITLVVAVVFAIIGGYELIDWIREGSGAE